MNRFAVAVLAIVVGAGCGKSKAKCKEEVDDLMTYLRTLDMEGQLLWVDDSMHLAPRPGSPKPQQFAPVVVIGAKQTTFKGELADADLAERLKAEAGKIKDDLALGRFPKSPPPDIELIYFEIDQDAPWARVAAAANAALDAGFDHAGFVVGLPAGARPPPRTWVEDELEKVKKDEPNNKASHVAEIASKIVKTCEPLTRVYGRVSAVEGENKAVSIVEGTGPALVECGCDVDMPALRSIMYGIMGNPHPIGVVGVQLSKGGKPIAAAATATWAEVQAQLQAADVVAFATK